MNNPIEADYRCKNTLWSSKVLIDYLLVTVDRELMISAIVVCCGLLRSKIFCILICSQLSEDC